MSLLKQRLTICKEIVPYVDKYKLQWVVLLVLKVCQKVPILIQPLIFKFFIDSVITMKNIKYLYIVILLYLCLFLLETLLKVGHRIIDNILFNKITRDLRKLLWEKYMYMPNRKYHDYDKSDLVQRLNLDIDMVKFFLIGEVFDYITAVISIFVSLCFILSLEWHIAIVTYLLIPLSLFFAYRYKGKLEELSEKDRLQRDKMGEKVQDIPNNWKEVKANQLEKAEINFFDSILNRLLSVRKEKEEYLFKKTIVLGIKGQLIDSLTIYIVGGLLHFLIGIPVGAVIACVNYYDNILNDFNDIVEMNSNLEWVKPSITRVIEILKMEAESTVSLQKIKKDIYEYEVCNLCYSYGDSSKDILNNFNIKIKNGDKILIDGPSGKGKSTLMKLLAGELECQKGDIFYKGVSIRCLPDIELYKFIRKIDNEVYFMNITIREYMQMAKRDINDDEITQACNMVNLWEDIKEIAPMLDDKIGENGSKLSGGQRQKLALARLFVNNNKTLLLDEAFSAIDVKDKKEILNKILARYKNESIICVSHDNEIKSMFHTKINIQ